ncbi:GNAT family N-acetyltransferase [Marinobacter nanhaiticus D15-8W]|nr:GNAT family N-acetyltransferase [Marinobacter nanhaiticus]BES73198.1 GNAT family N-acetyltransferase [Marinobacter nanhaiticus D15-8W]
MQVEPATLEDCLAIAKVHVESWQVAYRDFLPADYLATLSTEKRAATWREFVTRYPGRLLVARDAEHIVGFVAFGPSRDTGAPSDRAEIWSIYVKPSSWSSGVGRCLWLAALKQIRAAGYASVSLWVIAGNERAIRFYTGTGFVPDPESRGTFEIGGTELEDVRYILEIESGIGGEVSPHLE